jgi:HAD superfamily hydrolase (TIGR01509 family)
MATDYHTILFDFGGTLFSYTSIQERLGETIGAAASRLNPEKTRSEVGRAFNVASAEAWKPTTSQAYYNHKDVMIETYRIFAAELGHEANDDFLAQTYEEIRLAMVENFELREDCLSTLEELRKRGLGLAIVSNIDDDYLFPMIERCGIGPYLDRWTSSEEAQSCKPDRDFFLHCARLAGCDPDRALYVGDSPFHDVQGARGVGMSTALIVEEGVTPPAQGDGEALDPDFTIRRLAELLEIVEG